MRSYFFLICFALHPVFSKAQQLPVDKWTYIQADTARGRFGDFGEKPLKLRYFGLTTADITGDGFQDVISGRYWYKNPGGNMTGPWRRSEFPVNVDAILTYDVNGNNKADVTGISLPKVYWLEAIDNMGIAWDTMMIGNIPATDHKNSQGFRKADLLNNGKQLPLIAAKDGIYCFVASVHPKTDPWQITRIVQRASAEGFDIADVDGDGFLDIIAGDCLPGNEKMPTVVKWYKNPGLISADWSSQVVGETIHDIDRICVGDFDKNGVADVAVTEERYPGKEPDAHFYVFSGTKTNQKYSWEKQVLVQQYSMNNLDKGDINNDGNMDLITAEHKGAELKVQFFMNDGNGSFTPKTIDTGKENHLGTQLVDLDGDGDLDVVGIAWDNYKYLHIWRNDGIKKKREQIGYEN